MERRVVGAMVCLLGLLGGCVAGREVGETCDVPEDCAGGICQDIGTTLGVVCTQDCDAENTCPSPFVCGSDGICRGVCTPGAVMGAGAAREICVGNVFVACSTRDSITDCAACGCEPFGGGVCVAGRGCVPPAPDGTACASSGECTSGLCYSDTNVCGQPRADGETCGAASDCQASRCFEDTGTCGPPRADGEACSSGADCVSESCLSDETCGAPRAMGGACLDDADCETSNCSTNGVGDTPGTCLQELGTACTTASGTCQRCLNEDAPLGIMGRCSRLRCDETRAPTCPRFGEHQFECRESVMPGESYCYEICQPDEDGDRTFHGCYDRFDSCISGGMYCR